MPSTRYKGYALIDCNNFFVSCERVFKPHLNHKPVAVLSTNDGCIIARSQEVKDLGVPMGAPLFLYKDLFEKHSVITFSSNFELYGDLSDRVMQVIALFSSDLEIYSIDEAFVPIEHQSEWDFLKLRAQILQWTGIPVSIGLGPTKTLAKVANASAKKQKRPLFSLLDPSLREHTLKQFDIEDVWGIGRRLSKRLKAHQIFTAYDYIQPSEHWIRSHYHLPGLKTYLELKGKACEEVNESSTRKSMMYSKSFGYRIEEEKELKEAVSHYAAQAALKIRRHKHLASRLSLYLKREERAYVESLFLPYPSDDSRMYIKASQFLLKKMRQKGAYLKAGIYLTELSPKKNQQLHLHQRDFEKSQKLMQVLDQVNERYGKNTLFFAAQGLSHPWVYKRDHKSQEYTRKWSDLLTIHL